MDKAKDDPQALVQAFTEELVGVNEIFAAMGRSEVLDRIYVRVLCSILEGFTYVLKTHALRQAQHKAAAFSEPEIKLLQQLETLPNELRQSEASRYREPTWANLRDSIKLFARITISVPPLINGTLPLELKDVIAVRDRITHPKSSSAFTVSDVERASILAVAAWFVKLFSWFTEQNVKFIGEIRGEVNGMFQRARDELDEKARRRGEEGDAAQAMQRPGSKLPG